MASMLGWGDDKNQHIYMAKFDRDPLQAVKDLKADFEPCRLVLVLPPPKKKRVGQLEVS